MPTNAEGVNIPPGINILSTVGHMMHLHLHMHSCVCANVFAALRTGIFVACASASMPASEANMCQRCAARCWHVAACAAVVWVCCADRILLCVVIQGHILQAFSPANKVEVAHMVHVAEYNPIVRAHAEPCTDVLTCASMSMAAGDSITVMQVGTVGVAASGDQDSQGIRTIVQHAVLVLLTPADGGAQRCEVLTAKQLCKKQHMVAWLHSGHPTMDVRQVYDHLCREN